MRLCAGLMASQFAPNLSERKRIGWICRRWMLCNGKNGVFSHEIGRAPESHKRTPGLLYNGDVMS